MKPRATSPRGLFISLIVALAAIQPALQASSHREAPMTALDHKADITDFYAFMSYDDSSKVTMIMNVDPLLEPSNGPNYFPFDDEVRYSIKVDNNHDAREDVTFEFRFKTEIRLPSVFTSFVGAGNGLVAPANSPAPVAPGTPLVPPAVTDLTGPGSVGLGLRQTYSVTRINGRGRNARRTIIASGLVALPSNVGSRTMPDYKRLFDQAVYDVGGDKKVFAGTTDDPFWIDLGAAFDSLNFREDASELGIPGVLSDAQDADDSNNSAPDAVAGFNVNTIAIEVPLEMLTATGKVHGPNDPQATIGTWATTSRPRFTIRPNRATGRNINSRSYVQIQRMANPLFNELLIGTGRKDEWSRSEPRRDSRFANFALDPLLARVLNALYDTISPGVLPVPDAPRSDLLPLLQYLAPIAPPGTPTGPAADLLRLNTGVEATPAAMRSRLGFLGGDPAGFPNGRRVSDDVVDIASRVVAGVLAGPPFDGFPNNRIGDGVNANDVPYSETFPYVAQAHSGLDRKHDDPADFKATPVNLPPVAANDSVTTPQAVGVNLDVLANDSDPEGDTLNVTMIRFGPNAPNDAMVDIESDQTLTINPGATFSDTFTLEYDIEDGFGGTDTGEVTVTVTPSPSGSGVSSCPSQLTSPSGYIVGSVICFGIFLDPSNNPRFGIELVDSADSVTGNALATPSTLFAVDGDLEFQASSGGSAIDKFYIVTENAANLRPPQRPSASSEIFGPFNFGSLSAPISHVLSENDVATLTASQAASSFGGVVLLFHRAGNDIFNPGVESFAGARLVPAQ